MINAAGMSEQQELVLTIERMITGTQNAVDALRKQVIALSHLLSPLCRPELDPGGPVGMSIEPPDIKIETEAPLVAKVRSIKEAVESMRGDVLQLVDKLTK